jgi:hypothetical protein
VSHSTLRRTSVTLCALTACAGMALAPAADAGTSKASTRGEASHTVKVPGKAQAPAPRARHGVSKRKPSKQARRQHAKAPRVKTKGASVALNVTFNITDEHYEPTGCFGTYKASWGYYRICTWKHYDAGGYFTDRIEQYEYWSTARTWVPYMQYSCTTGISGGCYRKW